MSVNKLRSMVSSLLVIGMILLASWLGFIAGVQTAKAESVWIEETDTDFNNGTMDNVEINGTGVQAELTLKNTSGKGPAWINKAPNPSPSIRNNHSLAAISNTDKVLLYGGWTNDTWVYDLSNNSWTRKYPSSNPSIIPNAAMASIIGTDNVLLFGGNFNDETWIYDYSLNSWTEKILSTKPGQRSCHAMASIWSTNKSLLFGGFLSSPSTYYNDTWEYDYNTGNWTNKYPSGNIPTVSYNHAMTSVDGVDKVVLFGGNVSGINNDDGTWIYDLSINTWTKKSPPNKPSVRMAHRMATLYGTDQVLLFGGKNGYSNHYNDTWIYDLSDDNWTKITVSNVPNNRATHALTTIDGTQNVVLFGGWDSMFYNDTWVFNMSSSIQNGTYLSKPYDTGTESAFKTLKWFANNTANTSVKFLLRTAKTESSLLTSNFAGPNGYSANFTVYYTSSPTTIWSGHNGDRWIQYKAYLNTNNKNETPRLQNVSIIYNNLPETQLTTPGDLALIFNNTPLFKWNFNDLDSSQQSAFQVIIDAQESFPSIDFDSGIQYTSNKSWQFPNGTSYTTIPDGIWYWKVRTRDSDGDWGRYSSSFKLYINYTNPYSRISSPSSNRYYNNVNKIYGSAWPALPHNTSIAQVEIYLQRLDNNRFWNGSNWQTNQIWLLANGTSSWQYDTSSVPWISGVQYYTSSQATDNKSYVENNCTGENFYFDPLNPNSTVTYPINNSVLTQLSQITGVASDTGGAGIKKVYITIKRLSDNYYWNGFYWWTNQTWFTAYNTNNWYYNTNASLWSDDTQYQIQSKAIDNANNAEIPSFGVVFTIDYQGQNLSSQINVPINNSYLNDLNSISGTAIVAGNLSISQVEICIKRLSDSNYWNGTAWNNSQKWLLAWGNLTWNYNTNSVTWTSGLQYLVQSRATDNLSNVENPSFGNVFWIDQIKPSSTITTPVNNSNLVSLPAIFGTSVDSGGVGVDFVDICIKRLSDNYYWRGSNWTASLTWLRVSGTSNWNYNCNQITWTLGSYWVQSRATDNANNIETPTYGNLFTIIQSINPISIITTPTNNSIQISLNTISGTANAASNASILKVEIIIQRFSDSKFWNGTNWNIPLTWLLTTGTNSWYYNSGSVSWTSGFQYRIRSRATDNKSRVETPSYGNIFTFNSTAEPSSRINFPNNYGYYNTMNMISGIAWVPNNVTMSISKVELEIKRGSDNKYWNGSGWGATQFWLLVTNGTTSWNYDTSMIPWTTNVLYHLRSRATDNLSNVETNFVTSRFLFDTTKPSSAILIPANNTTLKTLTVNGTASDPSGSGISYVHIYLQRKSDNYYWSGNNWNNSLAWLPVSGRSSWYYSLYNVTWTIGTYLVKSKAVDRAGNIEDPGYGNNFSVTSILAIPSSYIISPTNNSYLQTVTSIIGTATCPGMFNVSKVEITIKCNNDNKYWTGSAWGSTQTWLLAAGNTSWSYSTSSVTWTSGYQYLVQSKATHNASCVETPKFGVTFNIDFTKPSSTIIVPGNNSNLNGLSSINGTAIDTGGAGLKFIELCLKRNSDNKYWDGNNFWQSSQVWFKATGTTAWVYYCTNITWSAGTYLVRSKATDNIYNIEVPKYGNVFAINVSYSPPASTINTPVNNTYLNSLNSISGTAIDYSGLGLRSVNISINRKIDNYYWSGSGWVAIQTWLTAIGTYTWSYNSSSVTWTSGRQYNIRSQATDNRLNVEIPGAGVTFTFDNQPPINLSIVINNGAKTTRTQTVILTLGAFDQVSGVTQMSFSNDNISWSAWEPFITNKTHNLSSGDGLKTVYFRVKDNASNIANPVSDTITLDTSPPILMSVMISKVKQVTKSRTIKLIIQIKDIVPRSFKIAFSLDGRKWSNWQIVWSSAAITRSEDYYIIVNYTLPEGDGEKTIYFKLQDEAGNIVESSFETIVLDTTPPEIIWFKINDDATYTNSEEVVFDLYAVDDLSNNLEMSFSYDDIGWTDWELYITSKLIILPTGDGEKIIYFRIKDEADNIANTSTKIVLDTTPPHSLSILINNGASETNNQEVTLSLDAADNISGIFHMSFSLDGETWSTWEVFSELKYYTLSDGDGEKTIYLRVMDNAGNIAEPFSATILLKIDQKIKDSDFDGSADDLDAFPNDPAASVDTDGDGAPDYWNPGKSQTDSTIGLYLDAFPIDPAASVDTDNDNYPDYWNPGKSQADSTTNLTLDPYPYDPTNNKRKATTDQSNFEFLIIILILFIIVILIITSLVVLMNKHQQKRIGKPYSSDKLLWELRNEIIHGKRPTNAELSDGEIELMVEEKYQRGEISEFTYLTLKNK